MIQTLLDKLNEFSRRSVMDYSQLETTAGDRAFVYRNGSMATVIRYHGVRRIVSENEAQQIIESLVNTLSPFFSGGAHEFQFVIDRDLMPVERLKKRLQPMYESASRLNMTDVIGDILDEQAATMASWTMHDTLCIVLYTHRHALEEDDYKEWAKNLLAERRKGHIHVPPGTQDETYTIEPLVALHDAYVDKVIDALGDPTLGALCTVLKTSEATTLMKQAVDPLGTPESWKAWLLPTSDSHLARRRHGELLSASPSPKQFGENPSAKVIANTKIFFPPPLTNQLLDQEGSYTHDGGYFEYAGRIYATLVMTVPPKKVVSASALTYALSLMQTRDSEGKSQRIPYRLSMRLRGDGMKLLTWRAMLAPLFSVGSSKNVKLMRAHKALNTELSGDQAVASISISMTTWVDASSVNAIQRLKSRIVAMRSAAASWGEMQVVEETIDRVQAFISSCPGISLDPCSVEGVGTLSDLIPLFPLGRPASPLENDGVELYRSLDGAILPTESHSSKQDFWLETITSPMGGGKSAQANRKHFEFVFAPGRTTLPFLHILDIGGSVSGMVELLQDALPEDKKYLAYMHTLRNNRENAVNMLDPKLGLRYPLDGDMGAIVDFLTALVTPAERDRPYDNMSEFCRTVLQATYRRFDDGLEQSQPHIYKPGVQIVDEALAKFRLDPTPGTSWYAIADMLGANGHIEAALKAHRKAVPLLPDLQAVANDDNIRGDFMRAMTEQGVAIPEAFTVQLGLARNSYPIFSGETILDLRGRRITAIDLAAVSQSGSPAARKQASLMYQVAYELFSRNIRITPEDLAYVPKPWLPYYRQLLEELANTDKHVSIDEYHRTMIRELSAKDAADHDTQGLRATLKREAALESRKWALSVTTISQLASHHGGLFLMASANHILKPGPVDDAALQRKTMEWSHTDSIAMQTMLNGPTKGGVTFLSQWTTRRGKFNQLFTSTLGPKLLWSLSTTFEDKTIRKIIFEALGRANGRSVLAKHYPSGSAKDEVMRRKLAVKSETMADEDAVEGACREIANELISLFRKNPTDYK